MTRKEIIREALKNVGAKEVNGVFEMTKEQYTLLNTELENKEVDYSFAKNKKDESLRAIYDGAKKNKLFVIRLIKSKTNNNKENKNKNKKTGATVKVYGEKKEDGRSFKIIEVNNTKVHHYEIWLALDGKRKKIDSSENLDELIQAVKAA